MTRKLYYEDCHMRRFQARVLRCVKVERGFEVEVDATAFYPEGGGQACDLGTLGGTAVLDVQERGETVIHLCAQALEAGTVVDGILDFDRRFDLMQQHTGEHIVSGIIHRRYGYHNVGFHMGSEMIEIDFDGVVPAEDLPVIEAEANEALWKNIPLECWYPTQEELPKVFYRTKRALPWPVRIVRIPGYDSCACCGVHTATTGEVGLVKLFTVVGLRGGCRIEMSCGKRALALLNRAFEQNRLVSQAFSAKWPETGEAARKINEQLAQEKYRVSQLQKQIFEFTAKSYVNFGSVIHFAEDLEPVQIRQLADAIAEVCGGMAAVFSGSDGGGYGFAMVTRQGDLRETGKAMTAALGGRGGGKPNFQQGRVCATRKEIENFFQN